MVTSIYLVADVPKYFSLGESRALSSTAMAGLDLTSGSSYIFLAYSAMVGRVRVERTSSVFQTGAPTLYAIAPFIKRMLRQE